MRTHDGREPAPAGPLFGFSPEEAWRRLAFSGRQPCEVYAHPGPWVVAALLWPHAGPTYVALCSWCGYCGQTDPGCRLCGRWGCAVALPSLC